MVRHMNYQENKQKTSHLNNDCIPINLKHDLLNLHLSNEQYTNYRKYIILPDGDSVETNDLSLVLEILREFFNKTPIYKFMSYYINVEVDSTYNRINVEILPIIESA